MTAKKKLILATRKLFGDRLVDESDQDFMAAAVARSERATALCWQAKSGNYWLDTAYGPIEVWLRYIGVWNVNRNQATPVHSNDLREALFSSVAAAKAAGLIHAAQGFGAAHADDAPFQWKTNFPPIPGTVLQDNSIVASPLSDDYEYGQQRLRHLVNEQGVGGAEDENLIGDIHRTSRWWQIKPQWLKRAQGWYELNTPLGTLTVRRLVGWTVERNGVPLCWNDTTPRVACKRVIFDKLEDAQASAMAHAWSQDDQARGRPRDGTYWCKTRREQSAAAA